MSDRYCTKCGIAGAAGHNFCGRCGTALQSEESPAGNTSPLAGGLGSRESTDPQQHVVEAAADVPLPTPSGQPVNSEEASPEPASPRRRPSQPAPSLEPVTPEPIEREYGPLELHVQDRTQPIAIPIDGSLTIGSDQTCDVVLGEDSYVSARHARLTFGDRGLLLTDAGSTNGTFVRVTRPTPIQAGDEIRVGTTVLRVDARSPQA